MSVSKSKHQPAKPACWSLEALVREGPATLPDTVTKLLEMNRKHIVNHLLLDSLELRDVEIL